MRKYFVLILVIYILIGFLVSFSFGRRLSRHIKKIVKAMQDVEKGNLSTQVDIKTNDELKLISNGLNKMILKINENIREIYSTEARKREAELYALKSQIDPHFLFNILEVVRMRNIVSGDGETARMVKKLGQFYQAKLDYNEDLIDLKDEIEMMKKYIEIEIFRRKEKLELDIEIDSRFWACKIPIFTFQPLIENVLRHGTVKDRDIKITVSAAVIGDKVEITISDNGCGIKNEKLLEINSEINEQVIKKSYKHMGVKNVNYRLKLYFGLQYGITMESIYGDGTTIKLYLPWNGEGSNV